MKERKSYVGKLNGANGIWCDKKPRGIELEKTIEYYVPDEGKVFKKGDEYFDMVLKTENIGDYVEVDIPKDEEPKEEQND